MAKLPAYKRILKEDIKDAPDWIDRIINPINTFFESVYNGFNHNLDFANNLAANVKAISFTTASDYVASDTFTTIKFQHTLKTKIQGIILLQIQNVSTSTYIPIKKAVYVDWLDINGEININFISGLSDSTKYSARLLLI